MGAKLAEVRGQDERSLGCGALKQRERIGVDDRRDRPAGERRLEELAPGRLAPQAGPDDQGIRPFERLRRLLLELGPERRLHRQHVGEARARRVDRFRPGDELHESGAGGERRPGGVQRGARHSVGAAYDGDAPSVALVHRRGQLGQPRTCPQIGDEHGPRRIARREADVHDHDLAAPLAGEEVATSRAAERHGDASAHRPVGFTAREVEPRRSVDRQDRRGVGDEPLRQREHVSAGGARRPGAEQRVHRDGRGGPWLVSPDLGDAVDASQGAVVDRVVSLGIEPGRPHGDARDVQRAGRHPTVAAVVPGPGGHQRAAREHLRKLAHDHLCDGPARRLHQHPAGDVILGARRRVPGGGLGRREHWNRVHGITTPP